MANLLAIEAASDSCSIALCVNNHTLERTEAAPRMHSRLLYPMLNELMGEAGLSPKQLDAVIFVHGPGSFTGLRIAASTAQGIGFACDTPLIGISTLQAMAQQSFHEHAAINVLALMDARMNELYAGVYKLDPQLQLMQALQKDQLCPQDICLEQLCGTANEHLYAVGHGLKLQDKLDHSIAQLAQQEPEQILLASSLLPMAKYLLAQGQVLKPEDVELVYLREQSHWKTIKQQKALKKS